MDWLLLIVAGLLETVWAVGMPYTDGFRRPWPSVGVAIAMILSFVLLAQAARTIESGTAYAVWVAIGIVGATVTQAVLAKDPGPALRWIFVAMILVAVIGLKLTAKND